MTVAHAPAGQFVGSARGNVVQWLGIRYAVAQRFGEPRPAEPVARAACNALVAACSQIPSGFGPPPEPALTEDCLFLNVYSPAADAQRRPVVVWIHGGAFLLGSAGAYDGAQLAALGDIVVVAINYRLGVLGFADLSGLGVSRNLALLDQIAALRWVRENIAAFGGDPDRVTIAGESAGSMCAALLMLSPHARGLFHGAILQSGTINLIHSAELGAHLAMRWRGKLGAAGGNLESLRAAPVEQLLKAQAALDRELPDTIPAGPIFDGDVLPPSLAVARKTATPAIPIMAGTTRDECRLFNVKPLRGTLPLHRDNILTRLAEQLGTQHSARIATAYPDDRAGNFALATDAHFAMPTYHYAERQAACGNLSFVYRFDYPGLVFGAGHAIDLTYLWPMRGLPPLVLRGGPLIGRRKALAERFRKHWIDFVRTGHPGGGWEPYTASDRFVRLLDREDRALRDPWPERRVAWAGEDLAVGVLR